MPRKAKFPPPVHKCRGSARCRYKGKDYFLGPFGSEEADRRYKELVGRWAREAGDSDVPTAAALTVRQVAESFLAHRKQTHGDRRELRNVAEAVRPLVRLYGLTPAPQFRAGQLEELQEAMARGSWLTDDEKRFRLGRGQPVGWCRNRVNLMLVRVRQVFRWAERRGLVPDGHWGHLRTVPGLPPGSPLAREGKGHSPTPYDDLLKVCQHCPDPVAAMLELQWWTGMRSAEVRTMRACDIDRTGPVMEGVACWLYRPARHKNLWRGHGRVVPLGPVCQKLLQPWLAEGRAQEAFLFPPSRRRRQPCYTRHTYTQAVRRACVKAGVKITPYGGRFAAAERIAREAGPEAARKVLGHKSLKMTQHYAAGADAADAADTMRRLG